MEDERHIKKMTSKKITGHITQMCVIFGIIAIILADAIFFLVFPSAWAFFIIPAFMAFCLTKFVKFPHEILHDEERFNTLSKRTAITIAAICLGAVLIATIPLALFESNIFIHLITNFMFYLVCGVAVYTGYNRGLEIVTNAYYDSLD